MFLYHMRVNAPLRVIAKQFQVHRRTIGRYITRVREAICSDFVPLHYGFSEKHFVKCGDGIKRQFTKELVFGELSSWMSLKIADKFWERVKIIAVGTLKTLVASRETRSSFLGTSFVAFRK